MNPFATTLHPRRLWPLLLILLLLFGCRGVDAVPVSLATSEPPPPAVTLTPVAGGRSIGDAYISELGNTGYLVQHYNLRFTLTPANPMVEGVTTIDAISAIDGLAELSLDFVGFTVSGVTVDGVGADFRREERKLIVSLPTLLPAGRPFQIVVAYSGEPTITTSPYALFTEHLGLNYPDEQTIYTISEPDGSRYWFPSNDHPRDKATFRFEITVPDGLTAIANGELLDTLPATLPGGIAGRTFIWEHRFPMATYLALVAVGPYKRLEGVAPNGVRLRHYVLPDFEGDFTTANAQTEEAIAWFSDMLGAYPFEAFGYVTAHSPRVSMENQTMVLLSTNMVRERVMIHEISHMWFGNWVSLDSWADMWRNEGFATYMEVLWFNRDDPEGVELEMAGIEAAVEEKSMGLPLNDLPPTALFSFDSYNTGALLVHRLRQTVGDEAFFGGLRTYFTRYGGGTASQAEFQAVMEEASGQPLDAFFADYLKEESP